ncbi:hypothetical protein FHS24_000256 [Psychrobacter luti]|uniref:Uncharacterized protein n=1 Tax=Psychrobacter luti TaxID=198481 RepID=A0A839TCH6_9GAMM|nr:hypothetical protein [Psychrobacter luti]
MQTSFVMQKLDLILALLITLYGKISDDNLIDKANFYSKLKHLTNKNNLSYSYIFKKMTERIKTDSFSKNHITVYYQ